jgi:hypothetical protein
MAKLTGRVQIFVNGNLMLNKEGATAAGIGISGEPPYEREAIMGDTGLHGHVERPRTARLEVTITDRDDISLSELNQINGDGTVVFKGARGGKVYTMQNATCLSNLSVIAGDGETAVVFEGPMWTETTSDN